MTSRHALHSCLSLPLAPQTLPPFDVFQRNKHSTALHCRNIMPPKHHNPEHHPLPWYKQNWFYAAVTVLIMGWPYLSVYLSAPQDIKDVNIRLDGLVAGHNIVMQKIDVIADKQDNMNGTLEQQGSKLSDMKYEVDMLYGRAGGRPKVGTAPDEGLTLPEVPVAPQAGASMRPSLPVAGSNLQGASKPVITEPVAGE